MSKFALKTITVEGKIIPVTDSRVVAESTDTRHTDLLRKIKGYEEILLNAKLRSADFFIEDSYKDSTGKENKCYQLTKQGCEMVANKMTGKKGVLFTATYVDAFNKMQEQLKVGQTQKELTAREKLELHYQFSEENAKRIDSIEERLDNQTLSTAQTKKLKKLANSIAVPLVGGKGSNAYDTMIRKVYSDMYRQLFRELGVQASDEIKVKDFDFALEVMGNYKIATALKNDISVLNNQSKLDV